MSNEINLTFLETNKTVIYSNIPGVFIEPLVSVNEEASLLCPETPTNVCTIIDLELLLKSEGTFIFTQSTPLIVWTITHNLGKFPSVTVVDNNNQVVVGDINYINTNVLSITHLENISFSNKTIGVYPLRRS